MYASCMLLERPPGCQGMGQRGIQLDGNATLYEHVFSHVHDLTCIAD